jgi:hypothetical protein
MKQIRKFLQLSLLNQLLLVQTTFILIAVTLGLRVLPWVTIQCLLLKMSNWDSRFLRTQHLSVQHIAWAIRLSSWYVPKATCLPQALAAQLLLIQRGYPADLQIGVARNEDGKLEAHAWVTTESAIVIGVVPDIHRFAALSLMEREDAENYARAT